MLEFGFNVTERVVEIEILPDEDRNEMREAFTLHITPDQMMIADVQVGSPHKVLGSRPMQCTFVFCVNFSGDTLKQDI